MSDSEPVEAPTSSDPSEGGGAGAGVVSMITGPSTEYAEALSTASYARTRKYQVPSARSVGTVKEVVSEEPDCRSPLKVGSVDHWMSYGLKVRMPVPPSVDGCQVSVGVGSS